MHLPTFDGKIFCSTHKHFFKKELIPTTPLPQSHPFWSLWQDHLTSLQSHAAINLIDALVAIWLQDPQWTSKLSHTQIDEERCKIRQLLMENPPYIVILADIPEEEWSYGAILRTGKSWLFICINEVYVNLWQEAEEEVERLGLTALLRAALDHELGHWLQTIATGSFAPKDSTMLLEWKNTPKLPRSPWCMKEEAGKGEAGEWIECCSRGGLIEYNIGRKRAFLVTGLGHGDCQDLSASNLDQYRSSTTFPSQITARNPPLRLKLTPRAPPLKMKCMGLFPTTNACFHSMTRARRRCCVRESRK